MAPSLRRRSASSGASRCTRSPRTISRCPSPTAWRAPQRCRCTPTRTAGRKTAARAPVAMAAA
eukprot:5371050-Lingulodinium_polyedra.AAC.1